MSQTGAANLAVQGYEYQQILATYYPNAEVARLELKQ
jgi:peptidoglycan hydrolase-like amidase